MSGIFSLGWWKDAIERIVASASGGALTAIGADSFNIIEMDLGQIAAIAAGTGLVSLLKALVSTGTSGTPAAFGVATPTGQVVEKVVADNVVAGPANDMVAPGQVVRRAGAE